MRECVATRRDFAIETTLSGRSYLNLIRSWKAAGYSVKIIFLKLPSVDEAIARVLYRVRSGGHHVPEDVIRRRFAQGWANFEDLYRPLVDAWVVFDSSASIPVRIAEGFNP
jgi:predicted ABC-type ATPase